MLQRIGPPTAADPGIYIASSSSSQSTLLDACAPLVECLITLGQFDLLCSTAVLPVVPVRACVYFDVRFSSRCCCRRETNTKTAFQTSYATTSYSSTLGTPIQDHTVTSRSRHSWLLSVAGSIWLLVCRDMAISPPFCPKWSYL